MRAFTGIEPLFTEAYEVFLRQAQTDWEPCLHLMEDRLRGALPGRANIATLSLGCGDGGFDARVMAMLRRLAPEARQRYVGVDINAETLDEFRRMAAGHAGRGVDAAAVCAPMEHFVTDERFDLVHLMHSLYYVPGREARIVAAANRLLTDDGRLVVVVQSGRSAMHRLTRLFQSMVDIEAQDNSLNATGLTAILHELHLPFERVDLPFVIDARPCFDEDSPDGHRLLSFFCQGDLVHAPCELREIMRLALDGECSDPERLSLDSCAFVLRRGASS
jgi:SAM-dependent methyltransferase